MAQIADFLALPTHLPFDYQLLMNRLEGRFSPWNKIQSLCRSGEIIRVKNWNGQDARLI